MVTDSENDDCRKDIDAAERDCATLRWCFCVLTFAALIYSLYACRWTASLVHPTGGTCIVRLKAGPIWSPPETPSYADFVEKLPSLEGTPAPPWPAKVYPDLAAAFLCFALFLWPISIFTSIVYATLRRRCHDFVLHVVWWTAVCMTVCAMFSIFPWLLSGGWGPVAPVLFAFIGMVIGPLIAIIRQGWSGRAAELLAEKRSR